MSNLSSSPRSAAPPTGLGLGHAALSAALAAALTACSPTEAPTGPLVIVDVAGQGAVFSHPAGIECRQANATDEGSDEAAPPTGTCEARFAEGDVVRLAAVPADGHLFDGWDGPTCADDADGTETRIAVGLDDASCTASFRAWSPGDPTEVPTVVRVEVEGPGTVDLAGEPCQTGEVCELIVERGLGVPLAVTHRPEAFLGWGGACQGMARMTSVVADGDITCTANFDDAVYIPVRIEVEGQGRVQSTPAGIDCRAGEEDECSWGFPENIEVTLTAEADDGHAFDEWGHQCMDAFGNPIQSSSLNFVAETGLACSARFQEGWGGGGWTPDPEPDTTDPDPDAFGPDTGWTCSANFYDSGDGCDCGCGIPDPDCSTTVGTGVCQWCSACGFCDDVNPSDNTQCL